MAKNYYKARIGIICIFLAMITMSPPVLGFPPDNAAVLYLRAFILYEEPDRDLNKMLDDLRDGKIKPNDQIRQYFEKNRPIIELATTASQIPDCDWGRDHSKGLDLMMPELATVRKLAFMLVADSKVSLIDGDYKTSLERCLTIHRMARHIGDDLIISNLIGIAMNGLANKHIKIILSEMPADVETLEWLKNQMIDISAKRPSFISAVVNEAEISAREIRKERIDEILNAHSEDGILNQIPKEIIEKNRNGDDEYFAESRKYYLDCIASVQGAMALPYENAYRELDKLNEKITKEAGTNPVAVMTSIMLSSIIRPCTNEMVFKTSLNAVVAAIDIYLLKAKTGQLPDKLPVGLPKDLFSGKDFEYEKNDDGFILRCQGKDLGKDKIHEYEFKARK